MGFSFNQFHDEVTRLVNAIGSGGGGGGGSTVTWEQLTDEGEHIANIKINGTQTKVYAPVGGGGSTVELWSGNLQSGTITLTRSLLDFKTLCFVYAYPSEVNTHRVSNYYPTAELQYLKLTNSKLALTGYGERFLQLQVDTTTQLSVVGGANCTLLKVYGISESGGSSPAPVIPILDEPRIVGTWQGRTVYEKTYYRTDVNYTSTFTIDSTFTINNYDIFSVSSSYMSQGQWYSRNDNVSSTSRIYTDIRTTGLRVVNAGLTITGYNITIRYMDKLTTLSFDETE